MLVAVVKNAVNNMPEGEDWDIIVLEFGCEKEETVHKESCEKRLGAYREKLCECIAKR